MPNPTVRASSGGSIAGGSSSIAVTKPTGTVDGDYILVGIQWVGTISAPDGSWTQLEAPGGAQKVFGKIANSEGASWTFTTSLSGNGAWAAVTVQDVDQTTPVDVSGSQSQSSGTAVQAPSVTTTVDNALLIGFFFVDAAATFTPDASMTELQDRSGSGRALEATSEARATAGATGTRTATASSAGNRGGALIALSPIVASAILASPLLFCFP